MRIRTRALLRAVSVVAVALAQGTAVLALTLGHTSDGINASTVEKRDWSAVLTDDERLDRVDGNASGVSVMNQRSIGAGAQLAGVSVPVQPRALGALVTLLSAWSLRRARRPDASTE